MVSFTLTLAAAWSPSVNTSSRATCVPPGAAGAAAPVPPGVVVVGEPAGLASEASGLKGSLVAKAWKVSTAGGPGAVVVVDWDATRLGLMAGFLAPPPAGRAS